jgi:hypothetical protein
MQANARTIAAAIVVDQSIGFVFLLCLASEQSKASEALPEVPLNSTRRCP